MSWAFKAAKSKNELVPGSSRWVANELYYMNAEVLGNCERYYQHVNTEIEFLRVFMNDVLENQDNRLFVERMLSGGEKKEAENGDTEQEEEHEEEHEEKHEEEHEEEHEAGHEEEHEEEHEAGHEARHEAHDANVEREERIASEEADESKPFVRNNVAHGQLNEGNIEMMPVSKEGSKPSSQKGMSEGEPGKTEERNETTERENFTEGSENFEKNEQENPKSSPVLTERGYDISNPPGSYPPKTPSPLKNEYSNEIQQSSDANLSFIPIANTINPNKVVSESSGPTNPDKENNRDRVNSDDSFQAIRTAIRKSLAGKGIPNRAGSRPSTKIVSPLRKEQLPGERNSNHYTNKNFTGETSGIFVQEKNETQAPLKGEPRLSVKSNKTPKRTSGFVSLPSREPITISSSSNKSNRFSSAANRSLKFFERWEVGPKNETLNYTTEPPSPTFSKRQKLNPEEVKGSRAATPKVIRNQTTLDLKNSTAMSTRKDMADVTLNQDKKVDGIYQLKREHDSLLNLPRGHERSNAEKSTVSQAPVPKEPLVDDKAFSSFRRPKYEAEEDVEVKGLSLKHNTSENVGEKKSGDFTPNRKEPRSHSAHSPFINSIDSILRRSKNVFMNRKRSLDQDSRVSNHQIGSPPGLSLGSRSPSKSASASIKKPTAQSPTRLTTSFYKLRQSNSPTKLGTDEVHKGPTSAKKNESESTTNQELKMLNPKAESDLISRLMHPTSSSAAKKVKTPLRKAPEFKKSDVGVAPSKNKFLTTTLDPSKPQFDQNRSMNKSHSPIKRYNTAPDESDLKETKIPLKLDASTAASLKKKSLMAERSEAAAQRPKQRIMINMNQKIELKHQNGPYPVSKLESLRAHGQNENADFAKYKPTSLSENSKLVGNHSKQASTLFNGKPVNVESSGGQARNSMVTDNNSNTKKAYEHQVKPSDKKSFIDLYNKVEKKQNLSNTQLSAYLTQLTPETLPDIPSDDEGDKSNRIFHSWAESPQLHKLVMQNKNVDPVSVFGEVPQLNMDDIFD